MTAGRLWSAWARRWRVIASCLLLGVFAGAGAFMAIPPTYTSTAVVLVAPISSTPGTSSAQANMASERSGATSGEVLDAAVAGLQGEAGTDVATLRDSLSVTVPAGSSVLHIAVTTDTPARSATWANAVAGAYLARRGEAAAASNRGIAERLEADVTQVTRARAAASAADRPLFDQQLVRLWERQQDLLTAAIDPGRIVTAAQAPTEAATPGRTVFWTAGAALGLLLGLALALARDRWDPAVRHVEWLRESFGDALVADDPQLHTHTRRILARASAASPPARRVVLLSPDGPLPPAWVEDLRLAAHPVAAGDHEGLASRASTPQIVDASSASDPTGQEWCAGPGDLVVLEVCGRTRRVDVERVVAELGVARARVGYVAFRPGTGWAGGPVPAPTPPPGDADAPAPAVTRAHPGHPAARKHEVSR